MCYVKATMEERAERFYLDNLRYGGVEALIRFAKAEVERERRRVMYDIKGLYTFFHPEARSPKDYSVKLFWDELEAIVEREIK